MRIPKLIYKVKNKFVRIKKEKVLVPVYNGNLLYGRRAFITGGSSGIGYAIASAFLKNGARVVISGRNIAKLNHAKAKLIKEVKCNDEDIVCYELDITKIDQYYDQFNYFLDRTDKIDIFVNNAGVNIGDIFPDTNLYDFEKVLETNLKGMYFFSQCIFKYMVNNQIQGNILNITSSSSLRPAISPYIISKWGERSLTLGIAK